MSECVHGVFLNIFDMGVLLMGDSGIGKSELALALINLGQHQLIADDRVDITANNAELTGHCPPLLQDFLEVRGLGIVNIRALFGDKAISPARTLSLVIRLEKLESLEIDAAGRLFGLNATFKWQGIQIPEVTLPVTPGQNLLTLVEVAVRNQQLKNQGYHGSEDFAQRQRAIVYGQTNSSQ